LIRKINKTSKDQVQQQYKSGLITLEE